MIAVRTAMAATLVACWDAWRLLLGRIDDPATTLLLLSATAALGWRFAAAGARSLRGWPISLSLIGYAATCITGPALLQIGAAAALLTVTAFAGTRLPRLPLAGLAALLLPVLPTLDFLLAYPLRRVSAIIAVAMLRMNGVAVTLDGIALEWRGQQLLFDGPCSGVRMLWAALVLGNLIALFRRDAPLAYLRTMAIATGIAVLGNALRAASLFYLENGFVERLRGPLAHEAVGLLSFAMVAAAVIVLTQAPRRIA